MHINIPVHRYPPNLLVPVSEIILTSRPKWYSVAIQLTSMLLLPGTGVSLSSAPEACWPVHVDRQPCTQTNRPPNTFLCISSGNNVPTQACICEHNLQSENHIYRFTEKYAPEILLHNHIHMCMYIYVWNFVCRHILAKLGLLCICIFC